METLSNRGREYLQEPDWLKVAFQCMEDPYSQTNPKGYINLGIAANVLNNDKLIEQFEIISKEYSTQTPDLFGYGSIQGYPPLIQQLSELFSTYIFKTKTNPQHFSIGLGAGGILEALGSIICDWDEFLMIPSPMYHAFENDFFKRFHTKILPVQMAIQNGSYVVDVAILEKTLEEAEKDGKKIRGFVYCNPHNPSGIIFSEETTKKLLTWCLQHSLHFLSDEIYALSTFTTHFKSVIEICKNNEKDFPRYRDFVHVIWSFSKDFGLNGYRIGCLYTENEAVSNAFRACSFFMISSNHTQYLLSKMLENKTFIDQFIAENRKKLLENFQFFEEKFKSKGIPVMKSDGAMFLWFNLLQRENFQGAVNREEEKKLWEKCLSKKVFISPGFLFNEQQPGWFRICFSCAPIEVVTLGIERIFEALTEK